MSGLYKFVIGFVAQALAIGLATWLHADERPNVVLFIADDISWNDLGCYGHPTIKSPNIDSLASSGLRFTNAYLVASSCSPSRCSLITGRYPHNTGAPELHTTLPKGQVLFPKLLRDSGYYTVLSGKNHMGPNVTPGFSKISKGKGPGKEKDWVQLIKDRPENQPFFCWYASSDAHRNWKINDVAPKYEAKDVIVPPFLFDGPRTREDLTGYYHEVSRFDHYVGAVCDELKRQGVLDNTLVIVMADNGRPFPRCKTRLYDSGIKTPFVVHFPKRVKAGVTDSLISSIDIAATILDVAGIEQHERIQGVSFVPILDNPKTDVRDAVFAEHNWHVYRNHERMVRKGDWLYIRNNFPNQQNLCREAYEDGAGEELWEMHNKGKLIADQLNVFRDPCPTEELFRVSKDPNQANNLAESAEHQSTLSELRSLLDEWSETTGDSIPNDPTPNRNAPPGKTLDSKVKFSHREMPGDRTGAKDINHPGPIK